MIESCDLQTLTLPEFEGFDTLSRKCRSIVESAHKQLAGMSVKDRRRPLEYGKCLAKIRQALLEECSDESWTSYCGSIGMRTDAAIEAIRIYEMFAEHADLLHMFPLTVQRTFARHRRGWEELLSAAMDRAQQGIEVTNGWLADQLAPQATIADARSTEATCAGPEDEEEDEDSDRDDDDDETDPYDGLEDHVLENVLSMTDVDASREQLCHVLLEDLQLMKKRLVTWMTTHKVARGAWYAKTENAMDAFVDSLSEWQQSPCVRFGE